MGVCSLFEPHKILKMYFPPIPVRKSKMLSQIFFCSVWFPFYPFVFCPSSPSKGFHILRLTSDPVSVLYGLRHLQSDGIVSGSPLPPTSHVARISARPGGGVYLPRAVGGRTPHRGFRCFPSRLPLCVYIHPPRSLLPLA